MTRGQLDQNKAKNYIYGGHSVVTFENTKTGNHLTYQVIKAKDKDIWFVHFYGKAKLYIGTVFGKDNNKQFRTTKKSKLPYAFTQVKGFEWVLKHLENDSLPENIKVYHEGICGRCGRKLTHPESIETGFGPECRKKV